MTEFTPFPAGPNVGTQLKALKRKQLAAEKKAQAALAIPAVANDAAVKLTELTPSHVDNWFKLQGWEPFAFQRETWQAMQAGNSGLLHAGTGTGKTLAVWLGALLRVASLPKPRSAATRILWITPMRALAADTTHALEKSLHALVHDCEVLQKTGDTDSATRARIQKKPPFGLVTTPESLTVMLMHAASLANLEHVQVLVVDEWHELLGNKRGVQLQLAIARLVSLNPNLQVWGVSATLGNLATAMQTLLRPIKPLDACLVQGQLPKQLTIDTLIPRNVERFPWAGHLGLKLLDDVAEQIDSAASTLIFTNTRAQAELWYQALLESRPHYAGLLALHHGSLDKSVREWVEQGLKSGALKAVVCTSSLDLGVDFLPVERVLQIGSPKGIARLLQRAGRSGHAPGRPSRITVIPTHSLEMLEAAAVRFAVENSQIESRTSPVQPLDVLVQHIVTVAMGGGFLADALFEEVRTTFAYQDLNREAFDWALHFTVHGGESLAAYPDYQRVVCDESGVYRVTRRDVARRHAMSVGTIMSSTAMQVQWMRGGRLGTIEESFIGRMKTGDCFSFAGRVLELVKVRDMTVYVRLAKQKKAIVPKWQGGKLPLSGELAHAVSTLLGQVNQPDIQWAHSQPEIQALAGLLDIQRRWSSLPQTDTLLIEHFKSREGFHVFIYPFEGRSVHMGLASLLAWRLSKNQPNTFSIACNDYGFELLSQDPVEWSNLTGEDLLASGLFSEQALLEDLLTSLNASELAQRHFREIARVSGLVFQGFPGAGKSTKQLQASSGLFFDVFKKYDPGNLLLAQAYQEALAQELNVEQVRQALLKIKKRQLLQKHIQQLTPLAFPLMVERIRDTVSSETLAERIQKMVLALEKKANAGT